MFWHGCNYPWSSGDGTVHYGLDFGANVWGSHLGVSTRRQAVERDFAAMAALGFTVARWFVFGDGRAGIVYDEWGRPAGVDPHFFVDLDAALEIARRAAMRLDLVLLDHRWMFEGVRDRVADPVTGALFEASLPEGRSRVLSSPAGRDALFERVIVPLLCRYGPKGERSDLGDAVLAYELMNEPDFVIEEWERDLSAHVARPLPFEIMAALAGRLSREVHGRTGAVVTLGCARLHNLWAWDDDAIGLDVLQVHWYPDPRRPREGMDLFDRKASSLGVGRPVLVGEFPGNPPPAAAGTESPAADALDARLMRAVANGYAGAWPWSFSGTDQYGSLPVEPLRRFARAHPDLVNPECAL